MSGDWGLQGWGAMGVLSGRELGFASIYEQNRCTGDRLLAQDLDVAMALGQGKWYYHPLAPQGRLRIT